ncbi:hypothetical protein [Methylomonas albis]|nr:hypothetical protein [Methylomonas albis]
MTLIFIKDKITCATFEQSAFRLIGKLGHILVTKLLFNTVPKYQ